MRDRLRVTLPTGQRVDTLDVDERLADKIEALSRLWPGAVFGLRRIIT